jgi:hypothetical protein
MLISENLRGSHIQVVIYLKVLFTALREWLVIHTVCVVAINANKGQIP